MTLGNFTATDKAIARDLLKACPLSRDRLPYTQEFEGLHDAFRNLTGRQIGRDVFWRLLSSAAKVGGMAKRKTKSQQEPRR